MHDRDRDEVSLRISVTFACETSPPRRSMIEEFDSCAAEDACIRSFSMAELGMGSQQ